MLPLPALGVLRLRPFLNPRLFELAQHVGIWLLRLVADVVTDCAAAVERRVNDNLVGNTMPQAFINVAVEKCATIGGIALVQEVRSGRPNSGALAEAGEGL